MSKVISNYFSIFFASVTTLIGAGVLGLPVVVFKVRPWVFFVVYFVALVGQIGLLFCTVEVLHKTNRFLSDREGTLLKARGKLSSKNISLNSISALFLPQKLQALFSVLTFLIYAAMLVCFGLAGTQSLAFFLEKSSNAAESPIYIVVLYFLVALVLISAFGNVLKYILTVFPYIESLLLITATLLIWKLPEHVRNHSFLDYNLPVPTSFLLSVDPFLMASATISGLPSTISVFYKWIPNSENKISQRLFLLTLLLALLFSSSLNVLWVLTVFMVSSCSTPYAHPHSG